MATTEDAGPFEPCARALEADLRQEVLAALLDADDPEAAVDVETISGDTAEQVALTHQHLPMLADHGYVRWDRASGQVRRGPRFVAVERLYGLLRTHEGELPWTFA